MNRKVIFFLLILVSVCAISHVSAGDASDNSTAIGAQIQDEEISVDESSDELQIADEENEGVLEANASDYRNIQQLIDEAEEGGTVFLDGTYVCDYLINVNKTVNIQGRGDGAVIKLSDEYTEYNTPFFSVNAYDVHLTNLKFEGGLFLFGGAITWQGDSGRITNCEFTDNIASSDSYGIGGALLLYGKDCILDNCTFKNNHAYQHGGAVIWNGDNGVIRDCIFDNNKASGNKGWGGALMLYADNCVVSSCVFTNNSCTDYGGAIATHNYTNKIVNCRFEDNYVINPVAYKDGVSSDVQGGAAIFSTCIGLIVDGCDFINNHADGALGGALSLSINNTVTRSYFKGNKALLGNDVLAHSTSKMQLNFIVLDYNETTAQSVYGLTEDYLARFDNTFIITKIDSVVTFSAGMAFDYGQSGSIGVIVEGGTLELENIEVLDHPEAKISYNDNVLVVSDLGVGEYTLHVKTTPDEFHNAVESDLPITVKKSTATISASKATVALKKGTSWTIKVIDSKTKKPIADMKLTLKIYTGSKYVTATVKTNQNGVASYQTKNLAKGNHKIIVSAKHSGYDFNTVTSSINVIKPTALKFKVTKKTAKDGATLSITVTNKATKKAINGVKVKLLIYTGKKVKTVVLKTKTKGKYKGVCGYGTNTLSVGTHKVVIQPVDIKYSGSATSSMVIKKFAKKYPSWTHKTSG